MGFAGNVRVGGGRIVSSLWDLGVRLHALSSEIKNCGYSRANKGKALPGTEEYVG